MAYEYSRVRDDLQKRVMKKLFKEGVDVKALKTYVKSALKSEDLKSKVQNVIYHSLLQESKHAKRLELEPSVSETIKCMKAEWNDKLASALDNLVSKSGTSLLRLREACERLSIEEQWESLGSLSTNKLMLKVEPIFAPDDLYDFMSRNLQRMSSEFDSSFSSRLNLSSLHLCIPTFSLQELCQTFKELHPSILQSDLVVNAGCKMLDHSKVDADIRACKVIESSLNPLARQICKTGCPHSQRFTLWCMSLSIDASPQAEMASFFLKLKDHVLDSSSLLDSILVSDVSSCISDNDSYFVFEDMAYQIALAFIRDPENGVFSAQEELPDNSDHSSSSCQFVPCEGFSCFIAPLCYLHNDVHMVYPIFKALYNSYFCHLSTLSDHPDGILHSCIVFEALFEERSPLLVLHFSNHSIDPVRLVFKWLFYGFAGYLQPDQLLYLWDRIIGFDTLVFLPILAAALLEFRTSYLMLATTYEQAESMLSDLHHVSVLPLLQAQLFL